MKLYIPVSETGVMTKAFTDHNRAIQVQQTLIKLTKCSWKVESVELPFIGRSVCFVIGYYGYAPNTKGDTQPVLRQSPIYACSAHAKQDTLWRKAEECIAMNNDPDGYIVTDSSICSAVANGGAFRSGPVTSGKLHVWISRLRVDKRR